MLLRLLTFIILISGLTHAQTSPVSWHNINNSVSFGGTISKGFDGNGVGVGGSDQILFGKGQSNSYDGYFSVNVAGASDQSGETKEIGYAPLGNPDVAPDQIVYGFALARNYTVTMYAPEGSATFQLSAPANLRLERSANVLHYYIDGIERFSTVVSIYDNLEVRARLISNFSAFSEVQLSYSTTRFMVDPVIDHPNKKISVSVNGPFPPYTIFWSNGDHCGTECNGDFSTTLFTEGSVTASITDHAGNKEVRMFSVGQLVSWAELYQTDFIQSSSLNQPVQHSLLKTIQDNKWGSGKSSVNFSGSSTTWTEYMIQDQSDEQAFGFSNLSTIVRRTRDIRAGFVISGNTLQVLEEGSVVYTTTCFPKDMLHIRYVNGNTEWYYNGTVIHRAGLNNTQDLSICGMVKGTANLLDVSYSSNQPGLVNTTWDAVSETGSIAVNVGSISGVSGPYHYLIGSEPVPHLDEFYRFVKDSVGLDIDSAAFYTGGFPNATHTFEGLEPATYFVSVFNSDGKRLMAQEIHIQAPLEFEVSSSLVISGNTLSNEGNQDAAGSLKMYFHAYTEEGSPQLNARFLNSGSGFIGFAENNVSVATENDLRYGFHLNRNKLYRIENAVKSTDYIVYRRGEALDLKMNGTDMEYYHNGNLISTVAMASPEVWLKTGVGLSKGQQVQLKNHFSKKKGARLVLKDVLIGACGSSFGSITLNPYVHLNNTVLDVWIKLNGLDIQATQINGNDYVFSNLIPGEYETFMTYQSPLGTQTLIGPIVIVHSKMEWTSYYNTNYEPSDESLIKSIGASGFYGAAKDNHKLHPTNSIVYFKKKFASNLGYAIVNWSDQVYSNSNYPTQGFLLYQFSGTTQLVRFDGSGNTSTVVPPFFNRFRTSYSGTNQTVQVGIGNIWLNTLTPLAINNGTHFSAVTGLVNGYGIKDVMTNMPCQVLDVYAKVDRDLRGIKYKVRVNEVFFYMEEEYLNASGSLAYAVYAPDDRINPIIDGNLLVNELTMPNSHGDNRFQLDVSALAPGAYLLEVWNEKFEKFYLRFIK